MREILADINRWGIEDEAIAVATVVQTWGSAPRGVGSKMAMTAQGRLSGSISGGCVEGAVVTAAEEVLKSGAPQLLHFGVADETAWEVGLACGGTIEVFVEKLTKQVLDFWNEAATDQKAISTATVLRTGTEPAGAKLLMAESGAHVAMDLKHAAGIADAALRALQLGHSERVTLNAPHAVLDVFIDVQLPSPQLIMIGAGHIAIALDGLARAIGYQTVVIDPRGAFANRERLPNVGALYEEWPEDALKKLTLSRGTAIAALTHDPKIDDPALIAALNSNAFYIGALGSKKTHAGRMERLTQGGLSSDQLARIHAPIGLEIGASNPEEIALSIMAQIVQVRHAHP